MAPRLPTPGGDAGNWGEILNDFLSQEHHADGTLKRAGISEQEADTRYAAKAETEAAMARVDPGAAGANYQSLGMLNGVLAWRNPVAFPITWFGARPNDPAFDNRAAINAAITAVHEAGGGEVVIPAGVWWVDIDPGHTVNIGMRSGVTLRGVGAASRIKVIDDTGDFNYLISVNDPVNFRNGYIEHIAFRDFVVDTNPTGNTTANLLNTTNAQIAFAFNNFHDIAFERVIFDPYCGVWAISALGGANNAGTIRIHDCNFRFVRTQSDNYPVDGRYDTSTIYASCHTALITNNVLQYEGPDAAYPDGAIEVHGPMQTVTGNIIENYGVPIWVLPATAGDMGKGTTAVSVTGNIIRRCGAGIGLFPVNGATALAEIVGANNLIHIDTASKPYRTTPHGIFLGGSSFGDTIQGVTIHDNLVWYVAGDTRLQNPNGVTINWTYTGLFLSGRVLTRDLHVHDNRVYNANGPGMRVAATNITMEDIWIHHNLFKDCGQMSTISLSDRSGIRITMGEMIRVLVEDNRVVDTGNPKKANYAWNINAFSGTNRDFTFRRNEHASVNNDLTPLNNATADLKMETATTSLAFTVPANSCVTQSVTVPGANPKDGVTVAPSSFNTGSFPGVFWMATVTSNNTVQIRVCNIDSTEAVISSRSWYVYLIPRKQLP